MHNVFNDRFFDRQGPAWHSLGHTDPKVVSAVKAVKKYKMDYNIFLANMFADVGAGKNKAIDLEKMAIMREPTHDDPQYRFFGMASEKYAIIQNVELAEFVDSLTNKWSLETVGCLAQGKTIFFSMNAGQQSVAKEEIKNYFVVTDTRDGGTSLKVVFTPVRVVCQNTLITGLKQAIINIPLNHYGKLREDLGLRINALKKLQDAQDVTLGIFEKFTKTKMSSDVFDGMLRKVFPVPAKPNKALIVEEFHPDNYPDIGAALVASGNEALTDWNYLCAYYNEKRTDVGTLLEKFNDEQPKLANTLWAGYNVVVEYADFRPGSEQAGASALFGERAKEKKRAFDYAYALVRK
jgi:hypothetical protein